MNLSTLWASFRALFSPKGVFNLELIPDAAPGAAPAALVLGTSSDVVAAAAVALAADAPTDALVVDGNLSIAGSIAAVAVARAQVATLAADAATAQAVAAPAVALLGAKSALATADPDDEDEAGAELESLSALSGGSELFVTVLKNLVSFAMDLGHDFDTAFDAAAVRAKAMVAPPQ